MQILNGHTSRVNDIAFSPDGTLLVSSANDGTVRLWDTLSGEGALLLRSLGKTEPVDFAPDGRHVLVRPGKCGLELWCVAERRCVDTLIRGTNATYTGGIAIARGRALAVANECIPEPFGNVISAWDTNTWKRRVLYRTGPNFSFSGLAFDPTDTRLVTTVGVLDVATGAHVTSVGFPGDSFAWSPSAPLVACAGHSPAIWVRNAETGALVTTIELGQKHVQEFAFSNDGTWLAVVNNEEMVRVWDTRTWEERSALAWGIGKLKCLAFSPDGTRAACGSHNGTILIWDWE